MEEKQFRKDNVVVRSNDLYMKFYGSWYVMDLDVRDSKILDDGTLVMYTDRENYTKRLVWDDDINGLRVRSYKNRKFQDEYILTLSTIRDISSYLSGQFSNIKREIDLLDSGAVGIEEMLWMLR